MAGFARPGGSSPAVAGFARPGGQGDQARETDSEDSRKNAQKSQSQESIFIASENSVQAISPFLQLRLLTVSRSSLFFDFCASLRLNSPRVIPSVIARRERITSRDSLNRPPFSSPLSSAEMDRKTGEKAKRLLTSSPCKEDS